MEKKKTSIFPVVACIAVVALVATTLGFMHLKESQRKKEQAEAYNEVAEQIRDFDTQSP